MGREKKTQKILRVPDPLGERLTKEAERRGLSQNELMIRLIEFGLDDFEKREPPPKW